MAAARDIPGAATPEEPLILPGQDFEQISEQVSAIVLKRPSPLFWWIAFGVGFFFVMVLIVSATWLFIRGVGVWGINIPVAWGFAIVNFVWWIGIGHAGTLISAILLLMKQNWRNSINRFAEAMTLFAVACAGMFPLLHLGRPQVFYFMLPYPDTMKLWPQWRSPLVWDIFAVSTYGTVSLIFWYIGLIPDLATMRDRTTRRWKQVIFGMLALGWRGQAKHWQRYEMAYLLLAALATPLVVSVHSIVGLDFAVSIIPGWHSTIFPPYFVAGAIYSGFAMVLTLVIPVRAAYKLHNVITQRHMNAMALVMLAMGLLVGYGYFCEIFYGFYSESRFEQYMLLNRMTGPYGWSFWLLMACNILIPQLLWFRFARRNMLMLFILSLVINLGMWTERFVIVITSLNRDFLPSAWHLYIPTIWDWGTLFGTLGFFVACMFLFMRVLPMIPMYEVKELIHEQHQHKGAKT